VGPPPENALFAIVSGSFGWILNPECAAEDFVLIAASCPQDDALLMLRFSRAAACCNTISLVANENLLLGTCRRQYLP
jgi:hypothetical protein